MYSQKSLDRISIIEKKIEFINNITAEYGSVQIALEDEQNGRAAILLRH